MRPVVHINCAMSADGKIALPIRKQTAISSKEDFARVHRLRNSSDAILVGVGTVLADDPRLVVKTEFVARPRKPTRILLDPNLHVPDEAKILDPSAPTIIFCKTDADASGRRFGPNVEVVPCGTDDKIDLKDALATMHEKGIRKLMVEGGSEVIWSFIRQGLFDRLTIYVGSMIIGGRTSPTPAGGEGAARFEDITPLRLLRTRRMGGGVLLEYEPV